MASVTAFGRVLLVDALRSPQVRNDRGPVFALLSPPLYMVELT